jgi:Ca2+-binding RTX toxin-like protein
MTTFTLTQDDLYKVEFDSRGAIVFKLPPIVAENYRAYGEYAKVSGQEQITTINNSDAYVYLTGPDGEITEYITNNPLFSLGGTPVEPANANLFLAVGHPDTNNLGQVNSNDKITVGPLSNRIFSGPGDDTISSANENSVGSEFVGGSGNDYIHLSSTAPASIAGGGTLFGDWADAPVVEGDTQWSFPSADPNVVEGNDTIIGGSLNDTLYGGGGDDSLNGGNGNDEVIGEDGDDVVEGGGGYDLINGGSGDDTVNGGDQDDVVDGWVGDDFLLGGNHSDTVRGGDGNDQLNGGLRGKGWTDELTGGAGADIFYLSYQTAEELDADEEAWWKDWGEDVAQDAGKDATKTILESMTEEVEKDAFESLAGGLILGGVIGVAASSVAFAIGQIFKHSPAVAPPTETDDVMVVTDFDPREDVLFLPLEDDKSIIADVSFFANSAVSGVSGWGAKFSTEDKVFAEVFLDTDFLAEFGLTSTNGSAQGVIETIFDNSLEVTSGGNAETGGIQNADNVFPYSGDPNDYKNGEVPEGAAETLALSAPEGATTRMFGAFAPLVVIDPIVSGTTVFVSGTTMGDFLSANTHAFAPQDFLSPTVTLTKDSAIIKGFGGDDIIFGGNNQDQLFGGDGNDDLYPFGTSVSSEGVLVELISGGANDDRIFLGGTAASVDGGDDNDTVTFEHSPFSAEVDLASGSAKDTGTDANGNAPDSRNVYTLVSIEHATGSAQDDTITGDGGDNILDGNAGNDVIHGGDGIDVLSYRSANEALTVKLPEGMPPTITDPFGGVDTVSGIEGIGGSDFSDSVTGNSGANRILGFNGNDTLTGGAGNDTFEGGNGYDIVDFADNGSKGVVVDLSREVNGRFVGFWGDAFGGSDTVDRVTAEAYSGTSANDLLQGDGGDSARLLFVADFFGEGGNDTLTGSGLSQLLDGGAGNDRLNGLSGDDTLTGGAGNDTIEGGNGYDIVDFADNGSRGVTVDLARHVNGSSVGFWGDAFGGSDTVDRASVQAYSGTSANDFLQGDGGNGTNPLYGADFFGEGGNDTLTGSGSNQLLDGGAGSDRLNGFGGDDTLIGGTGNDTVTGGAGNDTFVLAAGDGTDTFTDFVVGSDLIGLTDGLTFDELSFSGSNILKGSEVLALLTGVDTTKLTADNFTEITGAVVAEAQFPVSEDPITDGGDATSGENVLIGSDEADTLTGGSGNDTLHGHGGDDNLSGGSGDDVIDGVDGDDMIRGGSGDDVGVGGNGDDVVLGGSGNDTVDGSSGNDTVIGDRGDDNVLGGLGDDSLLGNAGSDTVTAGDGNDTVHGGGHDDRLVGDAGDDILRGANGDDEVLGGEGNDTLIGNRGDDTLMGGEGADTLLGSIGDDILRGGEGNDLLVGGDGDDTFMLAAGEGRDRILDFQNGADLFGLAGGLTFDDLTFDGEKIETGDEVLAVVVGVDTASLSEFDFVMV